MRRRSLPRTAGAAIAVLCLALCGQSLRSQAPTPQRVDVSAHLQIAIPRPRTKASVPPPAVLWLKPLGADAANEAATPAPEGYTLLQKDKTFSPHVLVIPVGSIVHFPNADPYFHNVFSLFDGRRFDLGLYEAGKTKDVLFSREGISYIFCNIHSEMSAVVLAMATPWYSRADRNGIFHIANVPAGEYEMHLWVEGQPHATLDPWVRKVHLSVASHDLGSIVLKALASPAAHTNEFGQPYPRQTNAY